MSTGMSEHHPLKKKQKLNDEPVHVETGSYENVNEAISAPTSAVTALALLSDTIMFSGHRDGSICRWNLTSNHQMSEELPDLQPHPHPQHPQKLQQPNRHLPDWIISSACVDLTNHEIYKNEEKLGIAGLVVRKNQESDESQSCHTTTTTTHLLYSWNHQREDMRMEINGIPQRVMIWNATTSERLSALMIDVGRCSRTKMYANPLVSCLVFCKLLVNENIKSASSTVGEQSTCVKVWTDAVIVALQATCEAPTKIDDTCASTDNANMDVQREASSSAASAAASIPISSLPKQATNTLPTGNILPFYELTRKRMSPWMAVGGFVRALAVVGSTATTTGSNYITDHSTSNYGYIISATESTRNPIIPYQEEKSGIDSITVPTNEMERREVGSKSSSNDGGQTSSIIVWDTASPGTVLHIFSLDDLSDSRSSLYNLRFVGSIYALTLSNCNHYLSLSMSMEPTGIGTNHSSNLHLVLQLPSKTGEPLTNTPIDDSYVLSLCGWYTSSQKEIAASHRGDLIVRTLLPSALKESIVEHFLTLYSFRDLLTSIETLKTNGVEIDVTKLPSTTNVRIPVGPAMDFDPTRIIVGESHVIVGYENGTTSLYSIPSSMQLTLNNPKSNTGSNEYVSCATAPVGLRGVPCPHLSIATNNVTLQNKCVVT
jgi:hypothetical protein